MKIGIVATEFLPAIGGMELHAAGLADVFAADNDVTVFTRKKYAGVPFGDRYSVKPILSGRIKSDVSQLRHERHDLWLALNAGYACLSRYLDQPLFVYTHGNDFIKPWTDTLTAPERAFVDVVGKLPYCWRFGPRIDLGIMRRRIASGLDGARMIFVNSRHIQDLLAGMFPALDTPVAISWPGVAEEFFSTPASGAAPHGGPLRLLTVACLRPNKNIRNVLHALAQVKGKMDFTYTVIGDGVLRQELKDLAGSLGILPETRFLGSLLPRDIIAHLDEADLFVLPSLIETFGIAYAEAAVRGVPSLSNRTAGTTDAILEHVNAVVASGPEPEQIADALGRFVRMRPKFDHGTIRQFGSQFRRSTIMAQLKDTILGATEWPRARAAEA